MSRMRTRNPRSVRQMRRERLSREQTHEKSPPKTAKIPPDDFAACPECGAVLYKGVWQWRTAPLEARPVLCPACLKIHENSPGCYLSLSGDFFLENRQEILKLARDVESHEKAEYPLYRIMDVESADASTVITTTTPELGRVIGEAIQRAYQGKLEFTSSDRTEVQHLSWRR